MKLLCEPQTETFAPPSSLSLSLFHFSFSLSQKQQTLKGARLRDSRPAAIRVAKGRASERAAGEYLQGEERRWTKRCQPQSFFKWFTDFSFTLTIPLSSDLSLSLLASLSHSQRMRLPVTSPFICGCQEPPAPLPHLHPRLPYSPSLSPSLYPPLFLSISLSLASHPSLSIPLILSSMSPLTNSLSFHKPKCG